MTVTNIMIKVSLKEPISFIESNNFLKIISAISEQISISLKTNMPQLLSLPFSDNQPAEIPFAVYQAPGQYSVILSRSSLAVSIEAKCEMKANELRKKLSDMLNLIFSKDQYTLCKKEISGVSVLITTTILGVNEDYIQDFIKKADIKKKCTINKNGFCLRYSTPTIEEVSNEIVSFASIIDENERLGVQISDELLLGGFNIHESTPLKINDEDLKRFIAFINTDRFDSRIEAIYGLSRVE